MKLATFAIAATLAFTPAIIFAQAAAPARNPPSTSGKLTSRTALGKA